METRKLGKIKRPVSLLGYGTMRFPVLKSGKIDEKKADAMLEYAYKHGVTYYDTAYPYHNGESELVLGRFLKTKDRDSFYVATKLPCWKVEKESDVKKIFNEQLKKVQVDHFDFYLIHALDAERWDKVIKLHVVEQLQALQKEGKITYLGFSFHDDLPVFKKIVNHHKWDFCQIQYNYMDTNTQAGDEGYAYVKKKGIPLVIMEPCKGGSLARVPKDAKEVFAKAKPDVSPASFAFRWVGNHDNVLCILSGMSTLAQVKDNIKTFDKFKPLNKKEEAAITKVKKIYESRVKVPCTKCRYCMPCPFGVDIPGNFEFLNQKSVFNSERPYSNAFDKKTSADQCRKCGHCMEQCPQHLPIPTLLEGIAKQFIKK